MNRANRSAQARLLLEQAGHDAVLVNAKINLDSDGIPSCVDLEEQEGTLIISPDARRVLMETLDEDSEG